MIVFIQMMFKSLYKTAGHWPMIKLIKSYILFLSVNITLYYIEYRISIGREYLHD